MAYTPTNWECGDTMTAEKMNKMEQAIGEINMSYEPTIWECGDVITAEKLNKMEEGIANGGGECDFSTAEVTIIYTGSDTIGFLGWWPFIADDRLGVGIGGNNEGSLTVDFLLYKNQPAVINFTDAGGCTYFYPYDAITVSGNATVDEYGDVTITGECTISLDGSEVEPM